MLGSSRNILTVIGSRMNFSQDFCPFIAHKLPFSVLGSVWLSSGHFLAPSGPVPAGSFLCFATGNSLKCLSTLQKSIWHCLFCSYLIPVSFSYELSTDSVPCIFRALWLGSTCYGDLYTNMCAVLEDTLCSATYTQMTCRSLALLQEMLYKLFSVDLFIWLADLI